MPQMATGVRGLSRRVRATDRQRHRSCSPYATTSLCHLRPSCARGRRESVRARIDRQSVRQYAPLSRRDQLTRPFRNITPGDTGHTLAEQPHRQSRTHAHVHARACIDTGSWSSSPRVHACVCACACGLVSSLLAASGRMCRATVPDMRTEPVTESAGRITRRSDRLPETPHHAPQGARGRREGECEGAHR